MLSGGVRLQQQAVVLSRAYLRWYLLSRSLSLSRTASATLSSGLGRQSPHLTLNLNHALGDLSGQLHSIRLFETTPSSTSMEYRIAEHIQRSEFADVEQLRGGISDPDMVLQPHARYEKMADYVLRNWGAHKGGSSKERVESFAFWLSLVPSVDSVQPGQLSSLLEVMRKQPTSYLPFLAHFALISDYKGYKTFAQEALSLLEAHMSADAREALLHDLLHIRRRNMVFEEPTNEYSAILVDSKIPSRSLLDIIQDELPELLPEPCLDASSLFEDGLAPEYVVGDPASRHPVNLFDTLNQLLVDEKHEEAFRLLSELQEMGVEMPFSGAYKEVAMKLLASPVTPNLSIKDLHSRVLTWMAYIPPAHNWKNAHMATFFVHVLRSLLYDVTFLSRLAILLASKGYAKSIHSICIPPIMRFGSAGSSQRFLSEYEAAIRAYWAMHKPDDVASTAKKTLTIVRNIAIRSLAKAQKIEEAMALLASHQEGEFCLKPYTCRVLCDQLRQNPKNYAHHLKIVNGLTKEVIVIPVQENPPIYPTRSPSISSTSLLHSLKHLRACFNQGTQLPEVTAISNFLEAYLASSRTTALHLLYRRAQRVGPRATSLFALAEMMCYRRMQQYNLVIKIYVDHFFITGIPQPELLQIYTQTDQINRCANTRAARIHSGVNAIPLYGKTWPSLAHTSIAWQALLALQRTDADIWLLYIKFTKTLKTGHAKSIPGPLSEVPPLFPPPSWKTNVSASVFTHFIRRHLNAFGGDRAAKILQDMTRLGIQPTIYHFTEIAGFYARKGDVRRAFIVLDKLESAAHDIGAADAPLRSQKSVAPKSSTSISLPTPDLVAYTSILRGFLLSRSLEGAEEIVWRIEKYFDVERGEYAYLDEALEDYEQLRNEQTRSDQGWVY